MSTPLISTEESIVRQIYQCPDSASFWNVVQQSTTSSSNGGLPLQQGEWCNVFEVIITKLEQLDEVNLPLVDPSVSSKCLSSLISFFFPARNFYWNFQPLPADTPLLSKQRFYDVLVLKFIARCPVGELLALTNNNNNNIRVFESFVSVFGEFVTSCLSWVLTHDASGPTFFSVASLVSILRKMSEMADEVMKIIDRQPSNSIFNDVKVRSSFRCMESLGSTIASILFDSKFHFLLTASSEVPKLIVEIAEKDNILLLDQIISTSIEAKKIFVKMPRVISFLLRQLTDAKNLQHVLQLIKKLCFLKEGREVFTSKECVNAFANLFVSQKLIGWWAAVLGTLTDLFHINADALRLFAHDEDFWNGFETLADARLQQSGYFPEKEYHNLRDKLMKYR